MKDSAIVGIFHGSVGGTESMGLPKKTAMYKEAIDSVKEELKNRLPDDLYQLHCRYVELIECDLVSEVEYYFKQGFKLGIKIGMECVED